MIVRSILYSLFVLKSLYWPDTDIVENVAIGMVIEEVKIELLGHAFVPEIVCGFTD